MQVKCLAKETKLKEKKWNLEWNGLIPAMECDITIRADATGIHKVKKQTAKLSNFYNYSLTEFDKSAKFVVKLQLIVILEKANHGVNGRWTI